MKIPRGTIRYGLPVRWPMGLFGRAMAVTLCCGLPFFVSLMFPVAWAAQKSKAPAAPKAAPAPAAPEAVPDDPLGRSTPQGTVMGFMMAVNRNDYERAAEYLDIRQSPKRAEQLARELQIVLDKGMMNGPNVLSRLPEGNVGDGLAPDREVVGTVRTGTERLDVELERVRRESNPPVWLFSSDTLHRVQKFYDQMDVPFVERLVPKMLMEKKVLHVSLWHWIGLFIILPLLFVVSRLVSIAIIALLRPFIHRFSKRDDEGPAERVRSPFGLFVFALAVYAYSPFTQSVLSRLWLNQVALVLMVISITWLCWRLIDVLVERTVRSSQMTVASGRIAITRLGGQFSKGLAIVIGAAVILYSAGIKLTAVLTGLGVGGIAIAFAAQKTLENLFGGIMIASDQPIRVGDFCKAGEYSGTVESVGLRSTRIRTIDRSVVSVPNGQLSVMSLENFALRDKIKFQHSIALRSETSADQLRYILAETRTILADHPKVQEASARVRLIAVKNTGFEIELFAYIIATSWESFLEVQEELLVGVIDVVEASGSSFASAFPLLSSLATPALPDPDPSRARKNDNKPTGQKKQTQGELI